MDFGLKITKVINYAGYHEMPQKVCERCIFHVRPYAFYFEMPQNRRLSFSAHFLIFQTSHVFFFEMPRFFMFKFFEMPHFSHFQRVSVVFHINLKSFLSENPKLTLAKMKFKNMPPGTAKKCFQLYCSKYQGEFFYLTAFSVEIKCHHQPGFGCQSNYF